MVKRAMKTIFDYIKNITNDKKLEELDASSNFSSFMTQRWLSMISPEICYFLNEKFNNLYIPDRQVMYDYLVSVFPKIGIKKIKYLKKSNVKSDLDIDQLAKRLQISKREILEYIDVCPEFKIKDKSIDVFKK